MEAERKKPETETHKREKSKDRLEAHHERKREKRGIPYQLAELFEGIIFSYVTKIPESNNSNFLIWGPFHKTQTPFLAF